MDIYEQYRQKGVPEDEIQFLMKVDAQRAKESPIIAQWKAGEITREKALDLLTELRGGTPGARTFVDRKLTRIEHLHEYDELAKQGIIIDW